MVEKLTRKQERAQREDEESHDEGELTITFHTVKLFNTDRRSSLILGVGLEMRMLCYGRWSTEQCRPVGYVK